MTGEYYFHPLKPRFKFGASWLKILNLDLQTERDDVMELEQQTKFDRLVRQLERSTRQRMTTNYQLRVAALATLGYGYIGVICLCLFSSLWMMRWLLEMIQHRSIEIDPHQLWVLFGLVAIVIFWVQSVPLTDRELDRAEFTELFTQIDELSIKLKTPKIHHVVINYDHNAAIYQIPHLGWGEWHCNYLLLGLPLLQSLTPEQFTATLAHELGHLANNDSSFTSYIFRVRQMWEQLTIDNNLFIFQWFFRWYEPLIKAYSLVSVRDREYAADALAQRMTSPEIAASDLIQTYIYQYYLQTDFNRQLDRQAQTFATPPTDVVTQMLAALRQPLDPQAASVWLGLILGQATDTDDTHPCLSDRLAAVGHPTPKSWTPQPILQTAAEYFFGDRLADLAAELDLKWYESHTAVWLERHQQAQQQQAHLATLDLQISQELTICVATVRANLTTELHGESVALPLWQEILAQAPEHPRANYQVGKFLVNRGHFSGCFYLEKAIELEPDLVISSCEELYRFHAFQEDFKSAEIYLDWRQQHLPKQWRSRLERQLAATDRFTTHALTVDILTEIQTQLTQYPIIARAYLVCKPMQVFKDRPLYVLAIELVGSNSWRCQKQLETDSQLEFDLCQQLQIELGFIERLVIATFTKNRSLFSDRQDLKLLENIQKTSAAHIF
ncbi:M48 family metallopeptidase [Chamaesiphon sp. OTE_8_metabat_110]|uniref:M48 family metallopeptidase n=1 Tax=Chamaesiphon sp. OTE_8_metabat_110 TaxID=2964696 RepID=UPI00286C191A|nr:M48 family metallopeptidase [Chamaesiphon sp. OTE_8_metabat_110]